ncbi:MAG TPA: hypothetical protein VGQ83_02920 [Polyangia bacterium]
MVFRVAVEATTAVVEGLLDGDALRDVLARCRDSSARRLVLRAGTVVRGDCMTILAELDLEVVAESPYLARWLERARANRSQP